MMCLADPLKLVAEHTQKMCAVSMNTLPSPFARSASTFIQNLDASALLLPDQTILYSSQKNDFLKQKITSPRNIGISTPALSCNKRISYD
jgi:hypothetical protein